MFKYFFLHDLIDCLKLYWLCSNFLVSITLKITKYGYFKIRLPHIEFIYHCLYIESMDLLLKCSYSVLTLFVCVFQLGEHPSDVQFTEAVQGHLHRLHGSILWQRVHRNHHR